MVVAGGQMGPSAGQRQRLSIALALVTDSAVLDQATSQASPIALARGALPSLQPPALARACPSPAAAASAGACPLPAAAEAHWSAMSCGRYAEAGPWPVSSATGHGPSLA